MRTQDDPTYAIRIGGREGFGNRKTNFLPAVDSVLLLEEPELSLNAGIVSQLAPLISRMQKGRRCQVLVSTHSDALLKEPGTGKSFYSCLPKGQHYAFL